MAAFAMILHLQSENFAKCASKAMLPMIEFLKNFSFEYSNLKAFLYIIYVNF